MGKLIEAESITKVFKSGASKVFALDSACLLIEKGDFISIVGPSGSGKSTFLHILGGLEYPTKGKLNYKGNNIYRLKDKRLSQWRNQEIGFVFQFYHIIEELNIFENVALGAYNKRKKSCFKKVEGLLQYLGIDNRLEFFPSQLSGGERQKVAIARAIINDPQVLLCDEPTGNLDVDSQEKVINLLEKLNQEKNKTIIMVTHNLELAKRAKRVVFIEAGKIKS